MGAPRGILLSSTNSFKQFPQQVDQEKKSAMKQKKSNLIGIVLAHYQVYKKLFFKWKFLRK